MTPVYVLSALVLSLVSLVSPAAAQPAFDFLKGLTVPYVPTNQATVEALLRIANVGPGDFVIDLGSGDGRILITAARLHGARGFGVDLDPQRVKESIENARVAGVADRVSFHQRDLFDTQIAQATVLTMYLLPEVNRALRPRLLAELKPGTRVVTHDFDLGEWKPDIRASVRGFGTEVHFYVIPAQVAGKWQFQVGASGRGFTFEAQFKQQYQEIEGTVHRDGRLVFLRDERLDGERIQFVLIDDVDYQHREIFDGRVKGNVIEGTMRGEGTAPHVRRTWRAVRSKP